MDSISKYSIFIAFLRLACLEGPFSLMHLFILTRLCSQCSSCRRKNLIFTIEIPILIIACPFTCDQLLRAEFITGTIKNLISLKRMRIFMILTHEGEYLYLFMPIISLMTSSTQS